jgi:hypothetical protein
MLKHVCRHRRLGRLVAAGLLLTLPCAMAMEVTQYEPVNIVGLSEIKLNLTLINNDPGAIYNSAEVHIFESLAEDVLALPANSGRGVADIIGEWGAMAMPPPTGEVANGWNGAFDSSGMVSLTHAGRNADPWLSTSTNPNLDELALTVSIPKSQLDGNGDGWSADDPADYRIVFGPLRTDAAKAMSATGFTIWASPAKTYRLIVQGALRFDLTGDGWVDAADVEAFAACAAGPGLPLTGDCTAADFDGDGDGDQVDFGLLQRELR